jgi:hypothetical protein
LVFAEYNIPYSKPKHGKMIVEWILEREDTSDLEFIANSLKEFIHGSKINYRSKHYEENQSSRKKT